ncbi:MAG: endonuclease domain-containing protein [Acidipropionibacterium sp.]|jgi:hypothetical protein|nr:endonuclease domain-containing protein [Acidipropionibacterium sp.]
MKFHELLRHAGITGWAANRELVVRDGLGREWVFFIDVAFEEERLAVEVNSRQFHDNPRAFLRDAEKARILTAAGWKLVPIVPQPGRTVSGGGAGGPELPSAPGPPAGPDSSGALPARGTVLVVRPMEITPASP